MSANNSFDYDICIIGGGIHGAGIAQISAAYGYKVLVLEKNTWGCGTSSRSSKLLHGGLRYLETAQFSLVRESLRDRDWLIQNAPKELAKPLPFYIPVYKHSKRGVLQLFLGLSLYAILGSFKKHTRFKIIPKEQWSLLRGINTHNLKTIFQYWDAQTNDQLLTESVIKSAEENGAELLSPAEFKGAQGLEKTSGYEISYTDSTVGVIKKCRSRMIINTAGHWVNTVQQLIQPKAAQLPIELIQGSHILIEEKIVDENIIYLEHPKDHRAVFIMPWENHTLIGTTEEAIDDNDLDNIKPTDRERLYLLELIRHYFPHLQSPKIINEFAGVRVLPQGDEIYNSRNRDTQFLVGDNLIALYGGKLTCFRSTSIKSLSEIKKQLGKPFNNEPYSVDNITLKIATPVTTKNDT